MDLETNLNFFNLDIPNCTICLEEMTNDLSVTKCGHVFHTHCITQSLEIRSSCPNCKNRLLACQVQNLIYSIGNVSKARQQHLKFVEELSKDEQKEFVKLLDKNEELFKLNEKENYENKKLINENKEIKEKVIELEKKMSDEKIEKEKYCKYAEKLKNKKKALKISYQNLELERDELYAKMKGLETEIKEFSTLRKLKIKMNEQDDEMLKTYREKYPFQEQAKLFYESVLLKKVEISNCKSQIEALQTQLKTLEKNMIFSENRVSENEKLRKDLDKNREILEKFRKRIKTLEELNEKKKEQKYTISENTILSDNEEKSNRSLKTNEFKIDNFDEKNDAISTSERYYVENKTNKIIEKPEKADISFKSELFTQPSKINSNKIRSSIANALIFQKKADSPKRFKNAIGGIQSQQKSILTFMKK